LETFLQSHQYNGWFKVSKKKKKLYFKITAFRKITLRRSKLLKQFCQLIELLSKNFNTIFFSCQLNYFLDMLQAKMSSMT